MSQPLTTMLSPSTTSTSMRRATSRRSGRASACPCGRGITVGGYAYGQPGGAPGVGGAGGTRGSSTLGGGLSTGAVTTGGPGGGAASTGSGSPIQPSPSQYRWVVSSAGSLYQPGAMSLMSAA